MAGEVSDLALAGIASAAYDAAPDWAAGDVHAITRSVGGARVIALRGTTGDPRDWLRDLDMCPVFDRALGFCHAGFLHGARALWAKMVSPVTENAILTGHSMGGALALLLAGLAIGAGQTPGAVVAFGAPRAGGARLARALGGVKLRLYRNGRDPVPDVPYLPRVYGQPTALIALGAPARDPLDDHFIAAYEAALAAVAARGEKPCPIIP